MELDQQSKIYINVNFL